MKTDTYYPWLFGLLKIICEKDAVTRLVRVNAPEASSEPCLLADMAFAQISEYLLGQRTQFTFPIAPKGTPFQNRVWAALQTIPYGETRTYGQLAAVLGNPRAARAVGLANRQNPIAIAIPCHRVIGQNGSLTGYAGGLEMKAALLTLEQTHAGKGGSPLWK